MYFEQIAGLIAVFLAIASIIVSIRTTILLIQHNRGGLSTKFFLTSLSAHVILWDMIRSLLVGVVSGVWFMTNYPDTGFLCNIIGPFTHIALRIPFFLALATLVQSAKSHTNSSAIRSAGWGVIIFGYILTLVLAVLPFTKHNSYTHGHLGFCTFYASDVIPVSEGMTNQRIIMNEVTITVLPFSAGYIVLALSTIIYLAIRGLGTVTSTYPVSILFSYMGMFGVGCFMIIDGFGYKSYTSLDFYNQFKLDFVVIIAMPVLSPVFSYSLATLKKFKAGSIVAVQSEELEKEFDKTKSTAILIDD